MKIAVSALVLSLFCSIETAQASPDGPSACKTDGVSVGGPHLGYPPVVNSTLADAGFELVINADSNGGGTVLDPAGMPAGVTLDGVYTFTVRATGNATFKGALLRFSEIVGVMEPAEGEEDKAKVPQDVCGPLPSLSHMDRSDKTDITGLMAFDTPGAVNLLVDLVFYNGQSTGSSYAFSTYPFMIQEGMGPDAGPDAGPATNMTVPPPMGNDTVPSPPSIMGNMTTSVPAAPTGNATLAPAPMTNETLAPSAAPTPVISSNVTNATTVVGNATTAEVPSTNMTNTTTVAPSLAPIPAAKTPSKAPVGKVDGKATSAAYDTTTTTIAALSLVVAAIALW
jgi:hypothetical protein